MAKIMFSERYGLQQAVMNGTKTMTRRVVKCPKRFKSYEGEWCEDPQLEFHKKPGASFYYDCMVVDGDGRELGQLPLPYKVFDIVAIAQSYKEIGISPETIVSHIDEGSNMYTLVAAKDSTGWTNKMFVREDLMPHHIQITDLLFERLQDISDEDCLKEGIIRRDDLINHNMENIVRYTFEGSFENHLWKSYATPREAFAALINKISGKGTWDNNPWVVAYAFKRID